MNPTEHEYTVAVDAAARHIWAYQYRAIVADARPGASVPPEDFDALSPLTQHHLREAALPVARAVLEALPDRLRGTWIEGYTAALSGVSEDANPYPL